MNTNGVCVRYVRCRRTEEREREEIIRCNLSLCLSFSPFLLPFVLFLASPLPLSNINEQFFFRTVAVVSHRYNHVFFFSFHRLVINKNSAVIRYVPDSQSFFLFISTSEREREKRFATVTSNNTQK